MSLLGVGTGKNRLESRMLGKLRQKVRLRGGRVVHREKKGSIQLGEEQKKKPHWEKKIRDDQAKKSIRG